ncbi:MobF family relaxase, partial [Streptosporangium saharense]|uniref:MobF family relaxase n=1 Tax=Streptosporangium saharense TaxID=1706840 RepID=UPI0033249180
MLSIAAGYDPGYLTRSVGRGAENYYLSAVAEHGEPPGIWWGEGARALGLEPGSLVEPAIMERLYTTFLDPRDPDFSNRDIPDEEKARLGRRPSQYKSAEAIFAELVKKEPQATFERLEELRIKAMKAERKAVYFFDLTFSPTKSVSLLHAGLQASALQAREAGQAERAEAYEKAAAAVWDAVLAGATASLAYTRDHAGAARAGYHGTTVEGRSTGRWTDAGNWVTAQFRQHTSREGEPQLHVHQAVLNRQLCEDGQWRSLDSRAVHRVRPAAAAVGERVMEEQLTRVLGVEWRARPDGHGREIVGVTAEQIALFSSRRAQVTADMEQRIADYEAAHGHKPSARALFLLAQTATKATKAAKPKAKDAPSRAEELRAWQQRVTEMEIDALTQIPRAALGRIGPQAQAAAQERLADLDIERVVTAAVREAQEAGTTFSRYEVVRAVARHLPPYLGGLPAERVEALLEELTDIALDSAGAAGARLLNVPDRVQLPAELQRPDGSSVYAAPCADRYTTAGWLDQETQVVEQALDTGAPRLPSTALAASLGIEVALDGSVVRLTGARPQGLRLDQAAAVYGIATSGRQVDVLVGPAGAGKSYTVAGLAEAWRTQSGGRVIGLTTAQAAAHVLQAEGLDSAYNIARWSSGLAQGQGDLAYGDLVIVDEASMVSTKDLRKIIRRAHDAGAKVVLSGDVEQLGAPEVGGMMHHLVEVAGAYELTAIARFREEWEREASLRLRAGDTSVLMEYHHRGRVRGGTAEEMAADAMDAYLADLVDGRQTLLLAPTNEQAAALSGQVRARLAALGRVSQGGVALRDGNRAGAGDLIMARCNDRKVEVGTRTITNRDVLVVESVGAGTLRARLLDHDGRPTDAVVNLPGDYVAEQVELAYAGTVHAAQGRTVDTCHALIDERVTREMLYVMLTRARSGSYAYTVAEERRGADLRSGPDQAHDAYAAQAEQEREAPDPLAVLAGVMGQEELAQTALAAVRAEAERAEHMAHLGSMWTDMVRTHRAEAYIAGAVARGHLLSEHADRLRTDPALGTLARRVRQIEMSGRDPYQVLGMAIVMRELDSADSVAETLHWRLDRVGEELGVDWDELDTAEELIQGTWADRTPDLGPVFTGAAQELAADMDRRVQRLGERAAERTPSWLAEALGGEVPSTAEAEARQEWIGRAGAVLAYREQYGVKAPTAREAIGQAPGKTSPEQRAAWYAAYDALGRPGAERDLAAATVGELWVARAAYERDLQWAPPYVADDLREVSIATREHAAEAARLTAQAMAVDGPDRAGLLAQAAGLRAMAAELDTRRGHLEEAHQARQAWWRATEDRRVAAMRADAELRRRADADKTVLLPPLHQVTPAAQAEAEQSRQLLAQAQAEAKVHEGQMALDLTVLEEPER